MQTSVGELTNTALSVLIEIAPGTKRPGTRRREQADSGCPSWGGRCARGSALARGGTDMCSPEIAPLTPIPLAYRRTYGRGSLQGADPVGEG